MTNYVKKLIRDGVEYEVAWNWDTLPKEWTAGQVLTKTDTWSAWQDTKWWWIWTPQTYFNRYMEDRSEWTYNIASSSTYNNAFISICKGSKWSLWMEPWIWIWFITRWWTAQIPVAWFGYRNWNYWYSGNLTLKREWDTIKITDSWYTAIVWYFF